MCGMWDSDPVDFEMVPPPRRNGAESESRDRSLPEIYTVGGGRCKKARSKRQHHSPARPSAPTPDPTRGPYAAYVGPNRPLQLL